jgi:L-ascorbate metabolism protein UlaG (beta-lactamase superfamily)
MRALKDIDVAFVCMNLPYTMDIHEAAQAVLDFKPKVIYPYHYRGQGGLADTEAFRKLVNDKNKNIEVRLRNWYAD